MGWLAGRRLPKAPGVREALSGRQSNTPPTDGPSRQPVISANPSSPPGRLSDPIPITRLALPLPTRSSTCIRPAARTRAYRLYRSSMSVRRLLAAWHSEHRTYWSGHPSPQTLDTVSLYHLDPPHSNLHSDSIVTGYLGRAIPDTRGPGQRRWQSPLHCGGRIAGFYWLDPSGCLE